MVYSFISKNLVIFRLQYDPQIYNHALENVEGFERFEDFISTFPIRRGKTKSNDEEDDTVVGELKVTHNEVFFIDFFH